MSRAIRPVRHAAGGVLRAAVLTVVLAGCALPASFGEPGGGATTADRASRPPVAVPAAREVERLVGLTREAVLAMLGPSTFTRRDGPAEIWRYATDDCFLTFFLHRGDQPRGAALTVHHVEANARTRSAAAWVNPRSCYGQVLQQRGLPQAAS